MNNFLFENKTKVYFGKGGVKEYLGCLLEHYGDTVMLAYGGGSIKHNGVYDEIVGILNAKGKRIVEFPGIMPNPTYAKVQEGAKLARENHVDLILAVGGGSVSDCCKVVSAQAKVDEDLWELENTKHTRPTAFIPLGTIVTVFGTGSEMNNGAVITKAATQDKLFFFSPFVQPRFSILDPVTTYTLPARQIANGVVDAFVHTLEQYTTYPVKAKVQDRFAEGLLRTLIEEGPAALANPQDYDVRANLMWTATMALNGTLRPVCPPTGRPI